jgi:mannitol/fructose-specific phosphotransferase system IIA component (Ntr-type)
MSLAELLSGAELVVPEMKATDRWEAIDELVDLLVKARRVKEQDRSAVALILKRRESSMSTGIGFGIGMPHASTDCITDALGALGRSSKGVDFASLDNQPVHLVFLFLAPQGQFQKHMHTLARVAALLHSAGLREAIFNAGTAEEILCVIHQET